MSATKTKKKESFETALERLEKIVTSLEDGELSLEEAIRAFEQGTKLVKTCEERLNEAKKRIEVLMGNKREALRLEENE